jgi:hypothetical protein
MLSLKKAYWPILKGWSLVILFLISTFPICAQTNPIARNGVIDLRGIDFSKETIKLKGSWAFYWNQYIQPDRIDSTTTFTEFPKLWNNTKLNGTQLPSVGYATYYLKILLPKKHNGLGFNLPDVYSCYRLYINGKLFTSNGIPGTNKSNSEARWVIKTLPFVYVSDKLTITLQVANFLHAKGVTNKEIEIGNYWTRC